jgi:hypothetical protein
MMRAFSKQTFHFGTHRGRALYPVDLNTKKQKPGRHYQGAGRRTSYWQIA